MYSDDADLVEGYTKSLALGLGGAKSAYVAISALKLVYIVPSLAVVLGRGKTRTWGILGYGAAVASRIVVAHATRQVGLPDVLAHPIAIGALAVLTRRSIAHTRAGTLTWRGRLLTTVHGASGEVAP